MKPISESLPTKISIAVFKSSSISSIAGDDVRHLKYACRSLHCLETQLWMKIITQNHSADPTDASACNHSRDCKMQESANTIIISGRLSVWIHPAEAFKTIVSSVKHQKNWSCFDEILLSDVEPDEGSTSCLSDCIVNVDEVFELSAFFLVYVGENFKHWTPIDRSQHMSATVYNQGRSLQHITWSTPDQRSYNLQFLHNQHSISVWNILRYDS